MRSDVRGDKTSQIWLPRQAEMNGIARDNIEDVKEYGPTIRADSFASRLSYPPIWNPVSKADTGCPPYL
jgi:hypothetical protein